MKVNPFAQICLILAAKFGDDPYVFFLKSVPRRNFISLLWLDRYQRNNGH